MKKLFYILLSASISFIFLAQCTTKGEQIIEPKFGTFNFRTYTTDTFRFRVILDGQVLTDSLLSPIQYFSRVVSFYKSTGRLQIIDAGNNNQLVLDTTINMQTGISNFSLLQLAKGVKPYIPSLPNEPPPARGNFKVRFQYLSFPGDEFNPPRPFFYDSVRVIVLNNSIPIDTMVLQKYNSTPYYEGQGGGASSFKVRMENPATNLLIDGTIDPSISGLAGFNTASVTGQTATDYRTAVIY